MGPETIVVIIGTLIPLLSVLLKHFIDKDNDARAKKEAKEERVETELDKCEDEVVKWKEAYFAEKGARLQAEADLRVLKAELESYKNRYQKGA